MADKPFRVLLDLTDLQVENFKYVWINVSPRELKTISDFKAALLNKINLEREDIKLFVRDGLLLEQETIIILREDDTVKVQYEEPSQTSSGHNSGKESKKISRKRNSSDCNINDHNMPLNKRKCNMGIETLKESSCLEKSSEKQKKHKKSLDSTFCLDNIIDHSENLEINHNELQSQKKKHKKKPISLEANITESSLNEKCDSFVSFNVDDTTAEKYGNAFSEEKKADNSIFDSVKESTPKVESLKHETSKMDISESFAPDTVAKKVEGVNNCPKKKRKRHKKRKHTESTVIDTSQISGTKFTSFSDSMDDDVKRKHIIYTSVPCKKDPLLTCDDINRVQDSPKDTFVVNKNVSTVNNQSFKDYPKISTPTQSGGCGNPSWKVSLMQSRNSVYKNEVPSDLKEVKPVVNNMWLQNSEENKFSSKMQYDDLPDVNSIPKIGTSIAYKSLELDESYSPVVSDYREGIVKNVNPDTEEIEIELLQHVIRPGRIGKFENLKQDELPMPDIKKFDTLRWSEIISPKQLS